jgi:hypothetical protein
MQSRLREFQEEAFPAGPRLDVHIGSIDSSGKGDVPERRLVVAIEPVLDVSRSETKKSVAWSTALTRCDLVWGRLAVGRCFEEGPTAGTKHTEHLGKRRRLFQRLEELAKRRPKAKHDVE